MADIVIELVEDAEAAAIKAAILAGNDIHARRDIRVALLDSFSQAQRAQRLATLMSRLNDQLPKE